MALNFITLGKLALPMAAVTAALLGSADNGAANSSQPLSCMISVSDGHFGHVYKGVVTANTPVSGRYEMKIRKRGANSANVNQSGFFILTAGETATIGQATIGGAGRVDAKMTLMFDGAEMTCGTAGAHDL